MALKLCFSVFWTFIFNSCAEHNYIFNRGETIRNHSVLGSKFSHRISAIPFISSPPTNLRKLLLQQQWLNYKLFSSTNCSSDYFMFYESYLLGDCVHIGESSFNFTASAVSNGEIKVTESSFNNTECSGIPLKVVTKVGPSCSNDKSISWVQSRQLYSTTNSIPSLPGGLLFR